MSKRTPPRPPRSALRYAKLLRKEQTLAEMILWGKLRNRGLLDLKFRRQHPIGRYIVDFFCSSKDLIVEVDGGVHAERKVYDRLRTEWL
jgi:adenine-specific DNA-methyltransferase